MVIICAYKKFGILELPCGSWEQSAKEAIPQLPLGKDHRLNPKEEPRECAIYHGRVPVRAD